MKKAILSLSGGLDSTCLLMYLLSNDYEVKSYSFQYGQKHQVELEKVKRNIEFLKGKGFKLSHQIIDLRDCFSDSNSSLHVGGAPIPEGHYAEENMKSTVIENRNVIFSAIIYGKALSWANKTESNVDVFLGLHSGDHCLPGEELVITEKGKKPIMMIEPGVDRVLSFSEKTGLSYQLVTDLVSNGYREDIYRVKTKGGRELSATSNHKFFKCDRYNFNQHTGWKKKLTEVPLSDLQVGDFLLVPYKHPKIACKKKDGVVDLLEFCNKNHPRLKFDDEYVWYQKGNKVKRFVSWKSFMQLCVWYITEGSFGSITNNHSNGHRIVIPQSRKTPNRCNEIVSLIKDWGFSVTDCYKESCQCSNFFFSGPTTYVFHECGDLSYRKKIPDFLFGIDDELLFDTLIKGDGHEKGKARYYSTKSPVLREQISFLGLKLGYSVVVNKQAAPDVYGITFYSDQNKSQNVYGIARDCKICEITSIEKDLPKEVFDITVENNHNFFAGMGSGVLVSNSIYPDCSEESRIACEHAFKVSNWGSERVGYEAPFNYMDKGGVLAEGLRAMTILGFNDCEINFVLGNTHTCYNPDSEGRSCGRCGSCIEESQKVLMSDNTWKQIKDVCIGDEVWSVDENTKKICVAKVLDKFDNGIQPVYDMAGLLLTKDHYVYASNMKLRPRYRKYEEMKRKDATYMVKFWPVSNTRKEVDDEKFALGYLRGFADGDGSIDTRGVHTFQKEFDVLEEFWSLYDKYIKPCDVKITYREDTNMHRAGGGYGPVFLEKTKFNEHPEYLRGYLNGMLIADGCACHNKSNESFGFSISQAVIVNKEKCIQIDKALSLLGIKCDRSQSVTPGFKEGGTLMQTWRVTRPYIITLKYGAGKRASMLEKLGTYNSIRLLDQVVVNKIDEPVKEAHVYDIKTSAGSFICEGYLVHNCTERLEAFQANGIIDPVTYQNHD